MDTHKDNIALQSKYAVTAWFYDLLDFPWEKMYKHWRPHILSDVAGQAIELGSGTGRNFTYYPAAATVSAIELSPAMIQRSLTRAQKANAFIEVQQRDATLLSHINDNTFDWAISTFMFCVMPDHLQPLAIAQMQRVLKPGGKFKILEMVYSKNPKTYRKQQYFAPWVEKIYGARFDRQTVSYLKQQQGLTVTHQRFLKDDTYLLIEGIKR